MWLLRNNVVAWVSYEVASEIAMWLLRCFAVARVFLADFKAVAMLFF